MRYTHLLILLAFVSLSFASELWKYGTDGAVSAKPVVYQGAVIIASDDGNIYALDPGSGIKRWNTFVGKSPNEALLFDNAVVSSVSSGKVVKIGPSGTQLWSVNLNTSAYNVSYIYGAAVDSKFIFVTTNAGLIELDTTGKAKNIFHFNSTTGPPSAGANFVVFGRGNELDKVSDDGTVQWKTTIEGGSFWLSRPVMDGNGIYIGALDKKLHYFAISNGAEFWSITTKGWVSGTPQIYGGNIYFGSDDGNVYSIDSGAQTRWTAQTQLAILTQPEIGTMGGEEVIFVGGSDKSIYAISTEKGQILWKGPAEGAVGSPLFYQNSVIFGTGDGKVYAFSTERACSITNPHEADLVGLKEIPVKGNFVSAAGNARVSVRINDGEWQEANTSEDGWIFYVDPSKTLGPALNVISCKVSDSNGEENGDTFTSVTINHDPKMPKSDISISVSPPIVEKKPFTVYVNDGDDGSPLERFTLVFNGNELKGDKNITLTINDPGNYKFTVKKMGFNDATVSVDVNASGVNPLFLVIGGIVIIALVWKIRGEIGKRKRR